MAQPPDADFIALQEVLAGEYSLDREIGRGGMGVVYLAREVRLARPVAITVLPPALSARPTLREAFQREARTAAALTHPNIVPVCVAGERGGFVFIAMALVEGTTVGERIRSRGKGRWGRRVARSAALGLRRVERPTLGMPLPTEVALGRATDHLLEALPTSSRRELAALPPTVRRLEVDAGRLRDSIAKLDDQLAMFDRGDTLHDDERRRVADELRETRRAAAARQVGDQISEVLAAQAAVGRPLLSTGTIDLPRREAGGAAGAPGGDDEADTPIGGVPAAHG